jgi:hypothetical protein
MIFALVKINNVAQFKIQCPKRMKEILKRYQIFFFEIKQFDDAKFPKLGKVLFSEMARKRPGFECDD